MRKLITTLTFHLLVFSAHCVPAPAPAPNSTLASAPAGHAQPSQPAPAQAPWNVGPGGIPPSPGRAAVPYVPIMYPKSGEVWLGATHHNVTWDTSNVPTSRPFTNTAVFLAHQGEVISPEPLASNFSLLDGRVGVLTPKEVNGDGFQVILFAEHGSDADRGSYSSDYTIVNVDTNV